MEMLVIGLVAIAAFAAVLIPLFRRRPGVGDESEFENIPPAATAEPRPGDVPPAGAAPADSPPPASRSAEGASTGMGSNAPRPSSGASGTTDPLESEVQRYRAAVRAGTVCRKCGQANPVESVYCYECGEQLPLADAKEFE